MATELPLRLAFIGSILLSAACAEDTGPEPASRATGALAGSDPVIGAGERAASTSFAADLPVADEPNRDTREIECDGLDQDGDGSDLCTPDADGDGVPASADCDDADSRISPLEWDVPCDGVDQNCNGFDECDSDGDGWLDRHDCDPRDPLVRDECRPARPDPGWISL